MMRTCRRLSLAGRQDIRRRAFQRGGVADAGDKGISAAAIKSIKQRILGDR